MGAIYHACYSYWIIPSRRAPFIDFIERPYRLLGTRILACIARRCEGDEKISPRPVSTISAVDR